MTNEAATNEDVRGEDMTRELVACEDVRLVNDFDGRALWSLVAGADGGRIRHWCRWLSEEAKHTPIVKVL